MLTDTIYGGKKIKSLFDVNRYYICREEDQVYLMLTDTIYGGKKIKSLFDVNRYYICREEDQVYLMLTDTIYVGRKIKSLTAIPIPSQHIISSAEWAAISVRS